MKKVLSVAVLSAALMLGACQPASIDVNTVISDAKAACGFAPAAAGVIALINALTNNKNNANTQTAVDVAQQICAAVNNVNPPAPGGGTKFAKGQEISVEVSGVTITGSIVEKPNFPTHLIP
jgi:hypothetical protein